MFLQSLCCKQKPSCDTDEELILLGSEERNKVATLAIQTNRELATDHFHLIVDLQGFLIYIQSYGLFAVSFLRYFRRLYQSYGSILIDDAVLVPLNFDNDSYSIRTELLDVSELKWT